MGTVRICLFTYFLCFTFGSLTGLSITTDNKDYDYECTLPALPEHGHYSVAGEDKDPVPGGFVGDETILLFVCELGYTPNGATTAICVQGSWITDFKQCHKSNTCIFPEIPINGSYKVTPQTNSVVFGTELPNWTLITFSCDPLFDLVGSRITLCRDGIWSKNSAQCKRNKRCHIPEVPKNGKYTIVGSDSFPVAGVVVQEKTAMYFKCDSGFNLIGGSVSMCQEALWLGGIPTCESNVIVKLPSEIKDCELPTPPEYGSLSLLGSSGNALLQCKAQEKHTIAFTCEAGYELVGREWSTCLDGNWTSDVPKCIGIKSCILPIKPTNGYYRILGLSENATAGEKVSESTVLLFSCDNHFNLLGSNVVFCENSSWSGSIPHCERYEECSNVQNQISGVYIIQPPASLAPFQAYCDLSLAGEKWTVIQSRSNNHLSFFRNYKNYTDGFGSISDDHWLGLAHIHELTKDDNHELYVELEHMDGKMYYARYSQFSVGNEKSGFKLAIGGYIGTAGVTEQLNYTTVVTGTTIELRWEPPVKHKACIKHYRIGVYDMWAGGPNIFDDKINANVNKVFYKSKIKACSIYNITLTPVTQKNDEDQTTYLAIETISEVEGPPALTLDADSTTTESLTFLAISTDRKLSRCELKTIDVTCVGNIEHNWQIKDGKGSTVLEDNDTDIETFVTVQQLSPFTNYNCKAVVVNSAGRSYESEEVGGQTAEDIPDEPNGGDCKEIQNRGIYAYWNEPRKIPGVLEPYEVNIKFNESLYRRDCQCDEIFESYNDSTTEKNFFFTNRMLRIYPFSRYVIEVNAQTSAGPGPSICMDLITEPTAPEPVRNINHFLDTSDLSYEDVTAILFWSQPCNLNGHLLGYMVEGRGTRRNFEDHFLRTKYNSDKDCEVHHLIDRLKPEYRYEFEISSLMVLPNHDKTNYDIKALYVITTPAGIPPEIKTEVLLDGLTLNVDGTDNSTKKVKIEIKESLFNNELGDIQYIAIMVAQTECNPVPEKGQKEKYEWPESKNWKDAQTEECVTYQTTEIYWNPLKYLRRSDEVITFTIGDDDCEDSNGYCNGPLLPNTKYSISVRAITARGYRDSSYIDFLTGVTEQLNYTTVVTGTTIELRWEPPVKHKACIKHYRIGVYDMWAGGPNIFDDKINANVNKVFYKSKIKACSIYNIPLTPVTQKNDEDQTTYLAIETISEVEGPPALTLDADLTTTESFTFLAISTDRKLSRCELKTIDVTCVGNIEHNWQIKDGKGSTVLEDNDTDIETFVTVQQLSPFTNYNCKAVVVNSAGRSYESEEVGGQTAEDIPDEPNGGDCKEIQNRGIYAYWNEPRKIPGVLEPYEVNIKFNESLYRRDCQCDEIFESYNDSTTDKNFFFTNRMLRIYPFSRYVIEVNEQTSAGPGPSISMDLITELTAPEPVNNINHFLDTSDLSYEDVTAILFWSQPCNLNGHLLGYMVEGRGTRRNFEDHFLRTKYNSDKDCEVHHLIDHLKPEYRYDFEISSLMVLPNHDKTDYDIKALYVITTPAGSKYEVCNIVQITRVRRRLIL